MRKHSAAAVPEGRLSDGPEGTLRGEDSALVRPYVLTPGERREVRRRRAPRRTLVVATHGAAVTP